MDTREQIKQGLMLLTQLATGSDSGAIKKDIDLLIGVTLQLVTELSNRNLALAKQCQSRKAKPPKASPAKGPQKQKQQPSSTGAPNAQNDTEDRPKALSAIQQGIRQADPSLEDQQRAIRRQIYGKQNPEVAYQKAAKAIVS